MDCLMKWWFMLKDLTGQKFGRLTVLKRVNDYISPKGYKKTKQLCKCSCNNNNMIEVIGTDLVRGKTKSCGCLHSETSYQTGKQNKKYNKYDLSGEYGIGYDCNNKPFYFDLEDYDKIKDRCWIVANDGYIKATVHDKNDSNIKYTILMHRVIMNVSDNKIYVDHIHGKETRNDNIKSNLRLATPSQNNMNKTLQRNNTSGTTGVYFKKNANKWIASITINKKEIIIGRFDNIEDAIAARKEAEEKYFGEYRYTGQSFLYSVRYNNLILAYMLFTTVAANGLCL